MDLLKKYEYVMEEASNYFTHAKYTHRVKHFDLHDHLRFPLATLEYQEQNKHVSQFVTNWLDLHPEHAEHRVRIENEVRYVDYVYDDMKKDIRPHHVERMKKITRAA
jgi:hypothetical protein